MAKNTTEELILIKVDAKHAEKELKKLTSAIDGNKKAVKSNEAQVKTLAKENKVLSKAVRGGSDSQKAAAAAASANTAKMQKLKTATKGLKEQTKALAKQQKNSKEATDDQSLAMIGMGGGLGTVKNAVQALGGGFKALFTVMKTNPLLLLAGILISIVAAFGKTKTGSEFLRKASAALGAVMGTLIDYVERAVNAFIAFTQKALEDPQKAMRDFAKSLYDNIVKYFTEVIPNAVKKVMGSFAVMWDAITSLNFNKFTEGITQYADGITDLTPVTYLAKKALAGLAGELGEVASAAELARQKAYELEDELMKLEMDEALYRVDLAGHKVAMDALKQIYNDVTKTDEVRLKAMQKAVDAETAMVERSRQMGQDRIDNTQDLLDVTESKDEETIKGLDLIAQKTTEQFGVQKKLTGILGVQSVLQESINKKNEKREEDKAKRDAEREAKAQADYADGINAKIDADEASNARGVALAKENIDTLAELEKEDRDRKINDLLDDANYNKTTLEQKIKGVSDYYKIAGGVASDARDKEKDALAKEREAILANDALTQVEKDALIEQNRLAELESLTAFKDAENEIKIQKDADLEEVENEAQERKLAKLDEFNQALQAGADIGRAVFEIQNNLIERRYAKMYASLEKQRKNGAISEEVYAKKKESLDKKMAIERHAVRVKQFALDKATTALEIGIQTARAIAEVLPNPILAGAVALAGAAQLAVVLTTPPPPAPSFADGGEVSSYLVGGKKHSQGGTRYRGEDGNEFEVERGEGIFVTKSDATSDAMMAIDAINKGYGGNSMFGHSHRWLQDGGPAESNALGAETIRQIVIDTLENMPAPVVQVETIIGGIEAENNARKIGVI